MTSWSPYWLSRTKKRWPYWIVLRMTIRLPYWLSKTKTWPPYCISFIWKKKMNAHDVTTAMIVQWNNETLKRRPCWIVLVCKNMNMTSPCQGYVTYQPEFTSILMLKLSFVLATRGTKLFWFPVSLILLFCFAFCHPPSNLFKLSFRI